MVSNLAADMLQEGALHVFMGEKRIQKPERS